MARGNNEHEKMPCYELADQLDGLEKIRSLIDRSEILGVRTQFAIFSPEEIIDGQNITNQLFAASLGKLPLAHMVIALLASGTEIQISKDFIDTTGGGSLDTIKKDGIVTVNELLDDMLRNSGNTAYRLLAHYLGGPDGLRPFYEAHWKNTTVYNAPNGRALIGETTINEAYLQLHTLLTGTTGDSSLRTIAIDSLAHNTVTKHGIRQFVAPTSTLGIFNKTGEYNGDTEDPRNYRHDVGIVTGPKGALGYAIMTTSSQRGRGILADMTVAQVGAELARKVGGRDSTSLASRAIRLAL
jgi:beta-lactamase class A